MTATRGYQAALTGARPSNRDNAVRLADGRLYHIDAALCVVVGRERVLVCDDDGTPYTLRSLAPYRATPWSNHLALDDTSITLACRLHVQGIWIEAVVTVNMVSWTAEVRF